MEILKNCPNCDNIVVKDFIKTNDKHYGVMGDHTTSQCQKCSLVFMNPMPNDLELAKYYPEADYYSYFFDINEKISQLKLFLLKMICVNFPTHDYVFNKVGKILDIGCGNGRDLVSYKNKGWEVVGVEPSKIACEIGNKYGLNIFNGNLIEANYSENSFDYIRLNHAFEHIYNPNEYLVEIFRVLKPNGKLFIGVPNIDSLNFKIFKSNWYYFGLPVHTFNYSMKTLCMILEKHDFIIEKRYYNSTWAGILGSIQILLNKSKNMPSNKGFVVNFKPFKAIAGFFAKILNILHQGDCIEVIATKK